MRVWFLISRSGFSLVEVILTSSVFVLITTTFVGAIVYGQQTGAAAGLRGRAALIAQEGLEAARNIRDASFANLTDGNHGLSVSANQWTFSGTQDIVDAFTRQLAIATVDANTKEVTATVSWQQTPQRGGAISLTTRLTNWIRPVGGWANPFKLAAVDLTGGQDGTKIQLSGDYAYVVRNSASKSFAILNVADPAKPNPAGSLDFQDNPKNLVVSGGYAYVASKKNSAELQIINVANPAAPAESGLLGVQGEADGVGIFLVGQKAYLGRESSNQPEFYVLNVSNPAAPSADGSEDLDGTASEVVVLGSYAYVASSSDTQELQVIDVSNPALPQLAASYDLNGTADALTIAGFGSTVLLGRSDGAVAIFNVGTPTNPLLTSSLSVGGAVNDLAIGRNNTLAFLATAAENQEFQIIDINFLQNPTPLGTLNVSNDLHGVAYDEAKDRAFAVGEDNAEDFIVVSPQQ